MHAVFLLPLILPATTLFTAQTLTRYESQFYILETDLPADRAKYLGDMMDATGLEYHKRFQAFRGRVKQKPRLKVFAEKEDYMQALRLTAGHQNLGHTAGLYNPSDEYVYMYEVLGIEHVLRHECFHQYADLTMGGDLPLWANEGLAEYFGEGVFNRKDRRLEVGVVPAQKLALLHGALESVTLIPVERLLTIDGHEWWENLATPEGHLQYVQSWALCHFLIHAQGGKYASLFDKFLLGIDQGLDSSSAFNRVFGKDIRPLQKQYVDYVRQLKTDR